MKRHCKTNRYSTITQQSDSKANDPQFNECYSTNKSAYWQNDFIYIQKNTIESRLEAAKQTFTVAETGFGIGINFLLTLQAYQKAQQISPSPLAPLNYISVEKSPLTKDQLIKSLSILPQLKTLARALTDTYPDHPEKMAGKTFQTSFLNNQVRLTLIFDEPAQGFSTIKCAKYGLVDAWYLDGFSSKKNSAMWSKTLFTQIGRLTKDQATLTTATIDGTLNIQLCDLGFRLEAHSVQDKKKAMLFAIMQSDPLTSKGYYLRPRIVKPQHVSIIGGGIASACTAYALTKQGIQVTLYCKDSALAQGGSSNAIGALFPLLHQQTDDISVFYQQAFWRAKALYSEIEAQGFPFAHQWCGLLDVSYKEALITRQQTFERLNNWPKDLIHGVNAKEASNLASINLPYGGLFMPNAGWLSPQALVKQIFNAAQATNRLKVITDTHISKITQLMKTGSHADSSKENFSWRLTSDQGEFNASVLVICAGAEAIDIEQVKPLPLTATRGQVTSMKSNKQINKLSTVICHKGYLTPEHKGIHCIGATFQKNDTNITTNKTDDEYNLSTLSQCLPELSANIDWQVQDIASSKARLRCMSQDHLPLVGAIPDIDAHIAAYPHLAKDKNWPYSQAAPCIDNLYVLLGLGARGLCSAPLAADILTAELCNTPYPLNNKMLFNLSPNRFIIRDIIKRKVT
ncbi:MAG: FAD-dependent 5-carboxymethylaminomethyl-2-thiouridine(34) oxidoreductase MnmC [Colwellia sp.]